MSLRGLLVLLLGLAIAVALLIGLGQREPDAAPEPPSVPLLAAFEEAALREIDLTCDGTTLTLRRDGAGRWRLAAPEDAEADPRRVRELVSALQDAKARKVIDDGASAPGAYGLEPAVCRVRLALASGAGERTLRVGRTSPVGTDRYASPDDGRIVLTDGALYTAVARRADAYREKRLIPVEPEAVTRMVIDRPGERIVLSQDSGVWRIESPLNDRASAGACVQLARAVAGITLDAPSSTPRPLEARADRRIAVELTARGEPRPRSGFVARAGLGGKRVAWRDGGALLGLVDEATAQELERPADAFRDRRVASFSSPDVRWVEVRRGGGVLRFEREREESAWTGREEASATAVDPDRVNSLLETLRVLTAVGFGAKLPPSGATGAITVGGADGALGELSWGPWPPDASGGGESLWVTTPSRPGVVFKVLATDLGPIPAHVEDFVRHQPPAAPGGGS